MIQQNVLMNGLRVHPGSGILGVMAAARPDLYAYLDHRRFLDDWFQWRKQENPRFSHRLFARLAGQSSPSLLVEVIKGRRNLTPATTEAFCRAMSLSEEECAYFGLLVQLDRAESDDERSAVFAELSKSRRFQAARRIEGASFAYLSHWYIPAVRELSACHGFRAEPAWIAGTMRPAVTAQQAAHALDVLTSLGMLQVAEDGTVSVVDGSLVTPHEVAGLAVHNYHRGMLGLALQSIERFPPAERHLGGVTVSVPAELVPHLKKALADFQERLLDLCDGASGPRSRVYQVGLQLFPLSTTVDPEPS